MKAAGSLATSGCFGLIVYHESNSYDLKQSFGLKFFIPCLKFLIDCLVDAEHHGSVGIDRGGMFGIGLDEVFLTPEIANRFLFVETELF